MSFDFASISTPFRMQPGLRKLAPGARQLTPLQAGHRHLREKLAVLGAYASQALLIAPGFDVAPAMQALCAHAAQEHPQAWSCSRAISSPFAVTAEFAHAHHLGWSVQGGELQAHENALPEVGNCLRALPAVWRLPALLSLAFAEDFAVIDGRNALIPWLAVCLPSQWAPEDKVGRHFAQVHEPVADNALLIRAGEHLSRLVTGADRWERFVWTITRHPRLHAHPDRVDPAPWNDNADADAIAAQAFFRTEHQTFIPLPNAHQAVFTILVELSPLTVALANPAQRHQVRDALASMSGAVLAYRGLAPAVTGC